MESASPGNTAELGERPAVPFLLPPAVDDAFSVDDELREWKRTRHMNVPWSQLALMASLCFGIGSFVLPDSVNGNVQWLLWGLTGVSAYVWFTNKRARSKPGAAT